MRAVRDRQLISGFCLEGAVRGVPGLTHCGEAWCSSRHRLESHTHSGFEFVYVTRGQASWRVSDQLIAQKMGDLLITYPQEAHATGGGHGGDFQLLWVGLDLARMGHEGRRLLRELTRERHVLLAGCHEIEGALRGAFSQLAGNLPHKESVAAHYLRTFVRLVEQRLALAHTTSLPPPLLPYSPATQRALALMQRTLDRRAGVAELAAIAGLGRSRARFAVRFQREVGIAPGAYHLRLRLDAARQALRATDASVTQIALRYGFSSSQHFSTAFRAAFGVTPRRWRLARDPTHAKVKRATPA
jgi:AraC-like DNA-binding protein